MAYIKPDEVVAKMIEKVRSNLSVKGKIVVLHSQKRIPISWAPTAVGVSIHKGVEPQKVIRHFPKPFRISATIFAITHED